MKFQNPFNPKYPANPRHFANRKGHIESFRKDLLYSIESKPPRPENIAIIGDWGIGKTSMLNKFADIASSQLPLPEGSGLNHFW
ncbi:MAG: P-loop NTPase fold protein [Methanosarcinales archaeon]